MNLLISYPLGRPAATISLRQKGNTTMKTASSNQAAMKLCALFYLLIGTTLLLLCGQSLRADTFFVANGDVAGLKTAINTANANGEDDTIELAANGTYVLTARDNALNGLPMIGPDGGHTLTIHGNPATIQRSTAGGTPTFRIFYINSGANVTLSRLTMSNGNLVAHGGAIYSDAETADTALTITNCFISGNTGDYGGAIYNDGYNDTPGPTTATLTIINSIISGNHGTQYGGGIWNDGSFGHVALTIANSTFSLNSATLDTGAIQHDAFMGTATGSITNCTFSQNSAGRNGGAVYIDGEEGSAMLSISSCTFSQDSASNGGGGIYVSGAGGTAALQLTNNILKTGASGTNIVNDAGAITSQGHNLSSDNGGGYLTGAGDQINTDPMLEPAGLQNNGGPTPTIALQAGSPAINAGDPNAPPRDQRYYIRSGAPDIGAFEFGGMPVPVQLVNAASIKTHGGAGSFSINLPLSGNAGIECRGEGASNTHTVVFTFANTLTIVGGATVSTGVGTVSSSGIGADAHQYIVNLTAVTNAQVITVNLTDVTDSAGNNSANVPVSMGVLLGDTTGNGMVTASDLVQTKSRIGQALNSANFRSDVNANGSIDGTDTAIIRSQFGTGL